MTDMEKNHLLYQVHLRTNYFFPLERYERKTVKEKHLLNKQQINSRGKKEEKQHIA
jgi:hypothetical protein